MSASPTCGPRAATILGTVLTLLLGLVGFTAAEPAAGAVGPAVAAGVKTPSGLTVGQLPAPADVGNLTSPLLAWQVPDGRQTAYQVQVAESIPALVSGDRVWDSGRIDSAASTNVPYAGPRLQAAEGYDWRVRTWDRNGEVSPWSRMAHFGTAAGQDWGDTEPIWLPSAEIQWADYVLEATFRITSQNATIVFNAQDSSHYLMWQFRGNGVDQLAPHVRQGNTFTVLKTVPLGTSLATGTDYRLRLEVSGSIVSTFLDDVLVDTTTEVPYPSGTIGFRTGGSERSSWDDLSVTSADGTVLYANDFEAPSSDFACGSVSGGRLAIGTSVNCVYGLGTDWAFLRGELNASDKDVRWATVFATGSSPEPGRQYVYKLWINGEFVGLGPTRSITDETRYDGYDVTDLVRSGEPNALGALAYTTRDKSFQAQLVVEYSDGTRQSFGTGPAWSVMNGGAVFPAAGSIGTGYFVAPKENLQAAAYPIGLCDRR